MEKNKKIALFTCHEDLNYGSMLQAYALVTAIRKLGYDAEYITYRIYARQNRFVKYLKRLAKSFLSATGLRKERNPFQFFNTKAFAATKAAFQEFHRQWIPASLKVYYSNTITSELDPEEYSTFIVGSDQLWSPLLYACDSRIPYFLDFAELPSRSSYATSLGTSNIPEEYKLILKEKLSAFDNISCRETFNTKMLSDLLNRNVSHVLDPTLLLSVEDWNKVATEPPVKGDYILAYILGEKDSITEFAHSLGQQKRLPVYFIVTQPKYLSYSNALTGIGPDAFIGLVKNARFVVTDSYHGCLFCIIFGTQFFAFSKREGSVDTQDNIRILEILQVLGLEDRFWDDTRQTPLHDCNFQQAHEKIADKRQTSIKYLSGCLQ